MLSSVQVGHREAVNVVDFDEKYIFSASGDRTIKVWNTGEWLCRNFSGMMETVSHYDRRHKWYQRG